MDFIHYINSMGSFQLLGVLGSFIYIASFACVQLGKLDGNSTRYALCNVSAAFLVALSLTVEFNLASALIQYSWMIIGLIGLALRWQCKKRPKIHQMKFSESAHDECS